MTVREYNDWYKKANRARSFVKCLDHALSKCDENARIQLSVIGWDEELKGFLCNAIECYTKSKKGDVRMVECEECVYRRSCCKTLKECRSYGGGKVDPQYIIECQRREIEELKRKLEDKTNLL